MAGIMWLQTGPLHPFARCRVQTSASCRSWGYYESGGLTVLVVILVVLLLLG